MELRSEPRSLECSECGDAIEDAGYLPAAEAEEGYEPASDAAVCDDCGFNAVGMTGCAPELDEVADPASADALLYVRGTDDGIDVISSKR